MSATRRPPWRTLLVATAVAMTVGGVGAFVTELGPWYYGLQKPQWQPPDWLFGPVWTVIFCMLAASFSLAWVSIGRHGTRAGMVALFSLNALLNIAWSWLFFRVQRPDWALYEVGVFWLSILALAVFLWPIAPKSSLLLLPYLIWVAFASILNLAIVQLNAPF